MRETIAKLKQAEETIEFKLELEKTISSISSRFVGIYDIDDAITATLGDIGKLSGASRAYLFLFNEDGTTMDNTHEWCAEGVSPQIDNLKNCSMDMAPWWMKKLRNNETIHITDVSKLPVEAQAERKILESQDIKSLLVLPLYIGRELNGFIGFDNVVETESWIDNDITLLRLSSEILGNALERKKLEKRLIRQKETIENIFKFVPEGLLVYSDKFHLLKKNTAFDNIIQKYSKQLNYSEEELRKIICEQVKKRLISGDKNILKIPKKKL